MKHKILPQHTKVKPAHKKIATIFLAVFAFFTLFILLSQLSPDFLTAKASNASTATRVRVLNSTTFTCNVTLPVGTSLFSLPCIPLLFSRTQFFTNLSSDGDNVVAIYKYAPSINGKWQVYNRDLPSYTVQTFSSMSRSDGLYVTMDSPEQFFYYGYLTQSPTIGLQQGWNLVGYPSTITRDIPTTLQSILGTYRLIRTLEGTTQTGLQYENRSTGQGNLTNASIYHGYWINMSTSASWVFS